MPTATFTADFTKWNQALANASAGLKSTEVSARGLASQLQKTANSFAGSSIIRQAQLASTAIEKIGGVTKLTAAEQKKANAIVQEGIAKYKALGESAPADLQKISAQLKATQRSLSDTGASLQTAGRALTVGLTLPIIGIGGAALKAAIEFESGFAGVRKTVNASESELKDLSDGFRNLAKTIPVTTTELNKIGEEAGALGIPKEHILEFTKVMAELGVTTNLTSEQAADSIARIQNIFGKAGEETDRFASTLVALGNAGASTESEIVEMAKRLAGAGNVIGLTQAQVLGFASALASVGIEAEAGGTAFSRVFITIAQAARSGGKHLEEFAQIAGKSAADFKQKFSTDAAGAISDFLAGLGKINKSGGDLFGTLSSLGLGEIRVRDALLRAAGSGDLFRQQLELANQAWKDNNALQNEASQRFKTTESQFNLLKNQVNDVAITLGQALIPRLQDTFKQITPLIEKVGELSKQFSQLPAGVQNAAINFGLFAAALGPATYGLGKLLSAGEAIAGVFAVLTGPIGLLILSLGAAEAAVVSLGGTLADVLAPPIGGIIRAFNDLRDNSEKVWNQIKDVIEPHKQLLTDLASIVEDSLVLAFDDLKGIVQPLIDQFDKLKATFKDFGDTLKFAVKLAIEDLKTDLIEGLPDSVKLAITAFEIAKSKLSGFSGDIHKTADEIAGAARQAKIAAGVLNGTFHDTELKVPVVVAGPTPPKLGASAPPAPTGSALDQARAAIAALPSETVEKLTAEIKTHALTVKQLATAYGLTETAIRLFKNQMGEAATAQKTLAKEQRDANKEADEYNKSIDKIGDSLAKFGQLTEQELSQRLGKLVEVFNDASTRGPIAMKAAVRALAPEFTKLAKEAEDSGFAIGIVDDVFNQAAKSAGLANLSSRKLIDTYNAIPAAVATNTNITREQSEELSRQAKAAEKLADAYHAFGLKTPAELANVAAAARAHYNEIVAAVGKAAPAAREAFKQVQEAEAAAAGKIKTDWSGVLDGLANAFAQLAQVAGGSFGGIVKWIGTVVAAMALAKKAGDQMRAGFDGIKASISTDVWGQTSIDWKNLAGSLAQVATGAIAAAGAIAQATAEGSKSKRILSGAASGAAAGNSIVPGWGAVVGAAIGAFVGWARANKAAEQAVIDNIQALKAYRQDLVKTYGTFQVASNLATAFGVDLEHALRDTSLGSAERLKALMEQVAEQEKQADGALQKYGLSWVQAGEKFQRAKIVEGVQELSQEFYALLGTGVSVKDALGGMSDALNDFLSKVLSTGQKIPAQFQPVLEQLIRMGKISEANARALLGLSTSTQVDFEKMQQIAEKYGISLAALGPKFQAAKITKAAEDIIADFTLLTESGADVGGVLDGMSDEISNLVQDAIKSGTALPDTMQPWIEKLLAAGKLVDGNGDKLTDLGTLQFEKPLSKSVDDLITKLGELIDKLGANGLYGAIDGIPDAITVGVHWDADHLPLPTDTHGGTSAGGSTTTGPGQPGAGGQPGSGGQPTGPHYSQGGMVYAQMGRVLPFMARGTDTVAAMLTPGERVLSVAQNDKLTRWVDSLSASGTWKKGGDDRQTVGGSPTFNIHINAIDGADVHRVVKDSVIPLLKDAIRRNEDGLRTHIVRVAG